MGYFKKQCTQYEKQHSRELKALYIENQIDYFELLSFLKNLADKYAVSTYNKVPYSILQNEVTKSFNNYISSGKHEYVKQIFIYMSILVLK